MSLLALVHAVSSFPFRRLARCYQSHCAGILHSTQSPGSEPMSFVYGVVDLAPRELLGVAFLMK